MDLSAFEVRRDWRNIDNQVKKEANFLWRQVQILVLSATLLVLVITILSPPWQLWIISRPIILPLTYLAFSLYITKKVKFIPGENQQNSRKILLGLRYDHFWVNILIGALAGGILGIDLILLSTFNSPIKSIPHTQEPIFGILVFLIQVFVRALGEEFLLRGIGFSSLYELGGKSFGKTTFQILFINLLMYSIQIFRYIESPLLIWIILFRLAYAYLTVFLRYRFKSTLPCISSNFIFNSLISAVLPW
jgi:membrane protease YdiL (CAAX protease family)